MDDDTSIVKGSLWMIGLSLLLFWLPVAGPLIAGFVGGRKAGGPGAALVAALLPAILVGVLVAVAIAALPEVGFLVGAVFGSIVMLALLVQGALVLLGAFVGGLLARQQLGGERRIAAVR